MFMIVCVCVLLLLLLFICIVQRNLACLTWQSAIEIKSLLLNLQRMKHKCKFTNTHMNFSKTTSNHFHVVRMK